MVEDEKSSSINSPTIIRVVRTIVSRNNLFLNITNCTFSINRGKTPNAPEDFIFFNGLGIRDFHAALCVNIYFARLWMGLFSAPG